jgi:hypothetical protein
MYKKKIHFARTDCCGVETRRWVEDEGKGNEKLTGTRQIGMGKLCCAIAGAEMYSYSRQCT